MSARFRRANELWPVKKPKTPWIPYDERCPRCNSDFVIRNQAETCWNLECGQCDHTWKVPKRER